MARFEFSGVLVRRNGKTLLVRERHARAKNLWSLPLGFVEKGESVREAAVREAKEESGYDVRLLRKVKSVFVSSHEFKSAHPYLKGKVRLTVFHARILGKRAKSHWLRTGWFSQRKIKSLKLRGEWEKKFLQL